jgi:5-(carboxyamino)imidazole ribonucleotide mutase
LDDFGVGHEVHAASAHKNPERVLEIIRSVKEKDSVVFVTIAGRSNALSGFVAANCNKPTLGCPPFKDKVDMSINIHSTLQMPSKTPVLTILDPGNCALAVYRILNLGSM